MRFFKNSAANKRIVLPLTFFFLIAVYFFAQRTSTIYGDDLDVFLAHEKAETWLERLGISLRVQKYRPIADLAVHLVISLFKHNTWGYFWINVAIQAMNASLLMALMNRFFKNLVPSFFLALAFALSRFCFFNISQLFNGGPLEGLAMTFCLLTLSRIVEVLIADDPKQKNNISLLAALFWASIAMYTHERYVILVAVVGLLALTTGSIWRRGVYFLLAVASIVLNIVAKVIILKVPFLLGTGGASIGSDEIGSHLPLVFEAFGSLAGINNGPRHLAGFPFYELPVLLKCLVLAYIAFGVSCVVLIIRKHVRKELSGLRILVWLVFLVVLSTLPAIATIRVEARFLQASYAILLLTFSVTIAMLFHGKRRTWAAVVLSLSLLIIDSNYLHRGMELNYLHSSGATADAFRTAIERGTIKPGRGKIYLWGQQANNRKQEIVWVLGAGAFFDFYGDHKEFDFVSATDTTGNGGTMIPNFSPEVDQVLRIENFILEDMTNGYKRDSLASLSKR